MSSIMSSSSISNEMVGDEFSNVRNDIVFDARVMVTEQMDRLIVNAAQELAKRAIHACASHYGFDGSEAIEMLNLNDVRVSRESKKEKPAKKSKVVVEKARFPLPYNGVCNESLCNGIRQNNGLYTQCQTVKKGLSMYCKSCQASADKNGGIPEYGNMSSRQAVGIFDYVDRKGRKPVAYTKVMKKFNVTQEEVLAEAGKLNMIIDENHFVEAIVEGKRGRPKGEKAAKEPKGAKGRPKKTKKVLEIAGDEDDLFASLVATANNDEEEEEEEVVMMKPVAKKGKSDDERLKEKEEKEAQRLKEKEEKEAQRLKEKEEKEAQRLKEKEAKLAAEKEAKAQKKQQEEEAKALKKQQEEEAKAQRLKEKESKASKSSKKPSAKVEVEEEQEADVVKKIEIDGKKYLKSKKSGLIYDYKEYTQNGEQVIVGKWNETKNKIDFAAAGEEESEEEYEEDEEE